MTAILAHILRHPIKSIGLEEIDGASLEEGRILPLDREWALLHERSKVSRTPNGHASDWGRKINFVIGSSAPPLMQVSTRMLADERMRLMHPAHPPLEIDPENRADLPRLLEWVRPFWPENRPQPTTLVRAPGQALTDNALPFLSLIGQDSLDDLSQRVGQELDRRRFRANLWIEGWPPFAEFDMIGKRLRIGKAVLQVQARIERCRATDTNIETGMRDIDMLTALNQQYGHRDLGVFCLVVEPGRIARGDRIAIL